MNAKSHLPGKVPNTSAFLLSSGAAGRRRGGGAVGGGDDAVAVPAMQKIRCIAIEADRSHREGSHVQQRSLSSSSSASLDDMQVSTLWAARCVCVCREQAVGAQHDAFSTVVPFFEPHTHTHTHTLSLSLSLSLSVLFA